MQQRLTLTLILSAAISMAAPGPGFKPRVRVSRIAYVPSLDSYAAGVPRPDEAELTDFRQRQPGDGQPASQPTTVYLSYDERNLYAVFVCRDDPKQIRAHMNRRDAISDDDKVGIALDTFHDGQRAYMFYSNPMGVQLDGVTTEGQADDYEFDAVWRSEGRITEDGYIVRFAIPFRSLRFSRTAETWGIALTRQIRRLNEYSCWPFITDRLEAYVPQFATLEGIRLDSGSRNIELTPYAAGGWQRGDTQPGRASREFRGGLDSKIVLRNALTLDFTANPDFSQVESDEPQVTVNRRYEVFFPEKRPFFLENAGFFETPETLFFSRRIIDPTFGARMTGRVGHWGIAALTADDRAAGVLSGEGGSARIGVGRVERSFGDGSRVGAFFSDREFGASSNRVAALDARVKLNANWVFGGQFARSSATSDGETTTGNAILADIRFSGRHLAYSATYRDRSPGFRADLGFIPRVDIRQFSDSLSYRWRPESGLISSFGPAARVSSTWNHQGVLQDWSVETPFWVELRRATTVIASHWESFEAYRGIGLRTRGNTVFASSDPVRWFGITASLSRGFGANYDPAVGLRPSVARSTDASLAVTFRPSGRLRFDETYYYSHLASGGDRIFTDHIMRSKVNYQFTRALSVRAILDYDSVNANPLRSSIQPGKHLVADLLVTYLLSPGTALYAGYNSRANIIPGETDLAGSAALPDRRSQLIFIKFAYRFRL